MVGVLYDVHGNLPALEAVLADARARGAARWLLGGDYAAFGAWPAETVARLDELGDATWIRGNWDRWLADPLAMPGDEAIQGAARAALAALDPATVARLGALPESHSEHSTLFCHASPRSDMDSFLPAEQPGDAELLEGVTEARVVFGHTHLQFMRATEDGVELVNPGSVGLPVDGDTRAAYALLNPDTGGLELHRVAYDVEASAVALADRYPGEPWSTTIARRLRAARMDA